MKRESDADPEGYWADVICRANALLHLGREKEALQTVAPGADKSTYARIFSTLIEDGHSKGIGASACRTRKKGLELAAGIAGNYDKWGMTTDAKAMLEKVLAQEPNNVTATANMIQVLMIEEKVDDAIALGEAGLSAGIEDGFVYGNLGFAYQLKGNCEKAIPLIEKATRLHPFSEANYTNLAKCLESVGRGDEAAKVWRYTRGGSPMARWWLYGLVLLGALALYFGGKLALIRGFPGRFGHLKFP
ncbi:MAG: hypothetical protein QM723_04435 [Myxococcaceae bacterium]